MSIMLDVIICILLLAGSVFDIRSRRIPNWTIAAIAALGTIHAALSDQWSSALIGFVFPGIALLLISPKLSSIGAGDIKLVGAVGLWTGWILNTAILISACLLALLSALIYRVRTGEHLRSVPFAPLVAASAIGFYLLSLVLDR